MSYSNGRYKFEASRQSVAQSRTFQMNPYITNESQSTGYGFNFPVNQQAGQQKRGFGSSYEQAQRQGFMLRNPMEHARPPLTTIDRFRKYANVVGHQVGNEHGPNKMRKVEHIEQAQARFQQQAQIGFGEPRQEQNQSQPQPQGLRYSNVEERPASQESVNALTQACLTTPLDEDEAQLLGPGKTNNDQNSGQMPNKLPASRPVMTPRPSPQGYTQAQPANRQGPPPPPVQRVMSSNPPSSSPVPFQDSASETNVSAIEATIERFRIKFHREVCDLFVELKKEVQQLNLDKPDSNSKQM
ncbi:uncharacterized protein FA14DRAFT_162591 [Meira miltonrushii]|uniref:Uncharacterized protein n=1 Tax=Meira miltonrushii TaxID=1280837 RepID=A0A316V271_9BASI|nr:uncharacterized protein FA14DRAFT_162591 [Meira miltonrushii]PWN31646.1 hypothetical protein FA14DRAFT_162591 [Meira miltonrushii]